MWNDEENENEGETAQAPRPPGRLVVVSGPSGSGKSTLVQRLLAHPELRLTVSVSATTRSPRAGEVPGRDYVFLTPEQFEQMRIRGELLEFAPVHGHLYGTPAEPVRRAMAQGLCVALVIDVQGGFQVREKVPDALLVFIKVPSLEILENRLRARGTDDEAAVERRLAGARRELELAPQYHVQVINDDLDRAVQELASILIQNGCGAKSPFSSLGTCHLFEEKP
jgi:guanylate kinase